MANHKRKPMYRIDPALIVERFKIPPPYSAAGQGLRLADGRTMYACRRGCVEVFTSPANVYMHAYHEWPHRADGPRRPVIDETQAPDEEVSTLAELMLPDMPEAPARPAGMPRKARRTDVDVEAMLDLGAGRFAEQVSEFVVALVESRAKAREEAAGLRAEIERLQEVNDRLMHFAREARTMADTALGGSQQ